MSMFKRFKAGNSSQSPSGEKPRLRGGLTDLQLAAELTENGRWAEALDVLNHILALPGDEEAAIRHLQAIMQDSGALSMDAGKKGRTASGEHVFSAHLALGGDSVPKLLAMRGECIWRLFMAMMERNGDDGPRIVADPEFESLYTMGTTHARLITQVCRDDAQAMFYAGMICMSCQQPSPAIRILQYVLSIDPNHEAAAAALPMAERAAAARGESP